MEQPKETDYSEKNLVSALPRDQFYAVYQTFMGREYKRHNMGKREVPFHSYYWCEFYPFFPFCNDKNL